MFAALTAPEAPLRLRAAVQLPEKPRDVAAQVIIRARATAPRAAAAATARARAGRDAERVTQAPFDAPAQPDRLPTPPQPYH